ncbi:MAG: crotonase/enoyl-CoA hydratase family protein [Nitrosomonadales bacterium]|nr:crotonase/enoyl-CoA hydratase family protein [Nitrosomonadales bacterium]
MGKVEFKPFIKNSLSSEGEQMTARFDPEYGITWAQMHPVGTPCFNQDLLAELIHYNRSVKNSGGKIFASGKLNPVRYAVVCSKTPGVFNLGGDIALFSKLINNRDRQALTLYSSMCIDAMFARINHYGLPVITISLVQGYALGGGLETVLSSDVIIAERSSKMGFPEILFNMFPGMGAYSLVARKLGIQQAEKMILGGKIYSAEELHQLGLVDVLVEDGEGEEAVYDYCKRQARSSSSIGFTAVQRVRQRYNPITYQEMMDITAIWVDAAMQLGERDLKIMDRLVRSQQKQYGQADQAHPFFSPRESRKTAASNNNAEAELTV